MTLAHELISHTAFETSRQKPKLMSEIECDNLSFCIESVVEEVHY